MPSIPAISISKGLSLVAERTTTHKLSILVEPQPVQRECMSDSRFYLPLTVIWNPGSSAFTTLGMSTTSSKVGKIYSATSIVTSSFECYNTWSVWKTIHNRFWLFGHTHTHACTPLNSTAIRGSESGSGKSLPDQTGVKFKILRRFYWHGILFCGKEFSSAMAATIWEWISSWYKTKYFLQVKTQSQCDDIWPVYRQW